MTRSWIRGQKCVRSQTNASFTTNTCICTCTTAIPYRSTTALQDRVTSQAHALWSAVIPSSHHLRDGQLTWTPSEPAEDSEDNFRDTRLCLERLRSATFRSHDRPSPLKRMGVTSCQKSQTFSCFARMQLRGHRRPLRSNEVRCCLWCTHAFC